jgi:hypothetical protein
LKLLLKCLFIAFAAIPQLVVAQSAFVRKGMIDLRQWNFAEAAVNLTGEWEFYMSELIDPSEFTHKNKLQKEYIDFPSTWNNVNDALNPGHGYATYRVLAIIQDREGLALEIPHLYSNYTLWINGKLLTSNGKVGMSAKFSIPQWLPTTIAFDTSSDTLDIVIQASNFHHAKGGIREPILLGKREVLFFKRKVAITSTLVMFGVLLVISATFTVLFFFKREMSLLYFAALCLTWAVRSLF